MAAKKAVKAKKEASNYYNLHCYIAPSISQKNYVVGEEVAKLFKKKSLIESGSKYLLDVSGTNRRMLRKIGVPKNQIQCSSLCSYQLNNLFHSYRREGQKSGRALGILAIRKRN